MRSLALPTHLLHWVRTNAVGLEYLWDGQVLARLAPGRSLTEPALRTARPLDRLSAVRRDALRKRLEAWLERRIARDADALKRLAAAAGDATVAPNVRAVAAMLADAGGLLPRKALTSAIGHLDPDHRRALYQLGVRLGPLDVFLPLLIKPAAQAMRAALVAVKSGQAMPMLPPPGAATLPPGVDPRGAAFAYRRLGRQWLRVDLADRLASHARAARSPDQDPLDRNLATSLGLEPETIARLMNEIGFHQAGDAWKWRARRDKPRRPDGPKVAGVFDALDALRKPRD